MKYKVLINVMPLKNLLDPQGKAVSMRLASMGLKSIEDVRIGKHMELVIDAKTEKEAEETADKACKDLLHNPIMESYEFVVEKLEEEKKTKK